MTDEERAADIAADCRERRERGEAVDTEEVVRAHPDIEGPLRAAFAAWRRLDEEFEAARAARSRVGRTLGPYRLVEELGAGGMGTVYLATSGDVRVAVKVLHPHLCERAGFVRRFRREADLGRRVRHENVVRTLDAATGECDGERLHFVVMEHVAGRTLRALVDDLGRLPEELCRHVGREAAKALDAIHAAGAVHRDVKPENVIISAPRADEGVAKRQQAKELGAGGARAGHAPVTPEQSVKVMDLGVARLVDESMRVSQSGAFVGSVRYAAPEQFASDEVDGRADLYALGLTLYELATGTHPFAGDEFHVVLKKQMSETPRPAGELNPQLSPFFEDLVARLVEKDRAKRIASAADLVRILEEGEESAWWRERSAAIRAATRRPLRRIRIPRETALYGRDAELAKLRALFDAAKAGDGQVVLVEGEAGIGKSRLVDEFVGRLAQSGEDVDFLFGSYPPGGAATASGAFVTAYREHLGDEDTAVRGALPQTPLLVPAFAALLRGDAAPENAEKLTKDSLQTVFVHATRSFAATRTTIVLIDDLHFAPEEGRALFASLALAAPGHRILLVGCARPGLDAKWLTQIERIGHATRLAVPRLTAKDLVLLLRDTLKSQHLAEELAGRIGVKSDGNPFFVFEILRGLREGQFITKRSDGTWATTREIRDIQVPSSVVELVQARVSDLGRADRNVLEVAACAGFEFDPALVGDVLGIARIPLLQTLGAIEKTHRLVRSAGRRFVFDHHQVMEVLYAGLSEPLREEYHASIAAAIEVRSGAVDKEPRDLDGALCVDLAEHYLKGAQGKRALRYLDTALTHLEKGYLHDAAVRLADRALAASGQVTGCDRCELLLRKSDRLNVLGRRDAQRAALEEALTLADTYGDATLRRRALLSLGVLHFNLSRHDDARAALGDALAIARAIGDRKAEVTATGTLGNVFLYLGRLGEAGEHFDRSLALAREIGDRRSEGIAEGNLGNVCVSLDRVREAGEHYGRSLALAREVGDRPGEAVAMGNLGNAILSHGRLGEAREHLERRLALSREIGDRRGEALTTGNLGTLFWHLGRLGVAREHYERSLALSREIGDRRNESAALHRLAACFTEERDAAASERLLTEALALRREIGHRAGEADSLGARGAHLARQGRDAEARADLDAALAIARELSLPGLELLATVQVATLPGGDIAEALAALAAHESHVEKPMAMQVRALLWQATRDTAHLAEAKRCLDFMVEHAPADCRESMLANVGIHREIAAAAREAGLPLAADTQRTGDGRSSAPAA